MKIYLDNIPVVNPSAELLKPKFTFRRLDETGDRAFSFTGDLEFIGADYDYIYAKLKSDPNAFENSIILKFVDDCCSQNKIYEFKIKHDSLNWCEGSCEITAAAIENSLADEQYTCLRNKMIWDDTFGFKSIKHPRMSYCNELRPSWLADVLMIMYILLTNLIYSLSIIFFFIAALIDAINLVLNIIAVVIPGVNPIDLDGDPTTTTIQQLNNFLVGLTAKIVGCGRKHPSPLVRDYAENVCRVCGITFVSSILNNPNSDYYNLVYVNAPVNKGTEEPDTTTYWIEENKPILTGSMFFDQIKVPFNAKWEIVNGQLIFEREDFFIPKTPALDLTTIDKSKYNICWSWEKKERYSLGDFYYQKDAFNWVGSEAVARWGDIVEWNPSSSYSSNQKGIYKPLIEFAACRFRDDGIDRDVLTTYEAYPFFNTLLLRYKNSMLMNSHNCFTPMLLIWDGVDRANAYTDKFLSKNGLNLVGINQYYNYPMWFKEGYPGNLYDRFYSIKNPRLSNYKGLDFNLEIEFDCDMLHALNPDSVIRTSEGDSSGNIIIEINYDNKTLNIKGKV
jgi:hypothetical protein